MVVRDGRKTNVRDQSRIQFYRGKLGRKEEAVKWSVRIGEYIKINIRESVSMWCY